MATRTDVKTETLLELAARCEAATEPYRGLDEKIALVVNRPFLTVEREHPVYKRPTIERTLVLERLAYTASIDAAMTLVPEGWVESYQRRFDDTTLSDCYHGGDGRRTTAEAATPALALCAAALRARAA